MQSNHGYDPAELLDIGTLQEEQHRVEAEALGYGTARYFYMVKLSTGTALITSPWFQRTTAEGRKAMLNWELQYWDSRRLFAFKTF